MKVKQNKPNGKVYLQVKKQSKRMDISKNKKSLDFDYRSDISKREKLGIEMEEVTGSNTR